MTSTCAPTLPVYHFTDTARFLRDSELRPGRNKIGAFPDPEFLWATSNAIGDCTARGAQI